MDNLFNQLTHILDKVSKGFTYETDQEQYGMSEKWVMPSASFTGNVPVTGDCEDFALACRKLCRNIGLQTRLVICTLNGEGHCVLECNGWILDNNHNRVATRDELQKNEQYVWYYISGYNPRDDWHMISNP